jgi:NitT/TauT family transport system substrate-binding protein
MGGPQINVMQLMAAGQADCTLGDNGQALETWQAGVHAVTVATVSSTRRRYLSPMIR